MLRRQRRFQIPDNKLKIMILESNDRVKYILNLSDWPVAPILLNLLNGAWSIFVTVIAMVCR